MSEGTSLAELIEVVWCVNMPSETILHLDSLDDFCSEFGKVLNTHDINESIQVQYADHDSA